MCSDFLAENMSCSSPPLWPQVRELCQQGGTCQRMTHTAYLTECSKTRFDDCSNVSTHGDICVSVDQRSRTVHTRSTDVSPTQAGPVVIWCWRQADEHQSTPVFAEISCSRLDIIREKTSSMHNDRRSCNASTSDWSDNP